LDETPDVRVVSLVQEFVEKEEVVELKSEGVVVVVKDFYYSRGVRGLSKYNC
jgi:hypothetical protein